jgi:hypothetical protein
MAAGLQWTIRSIAVLFALFAVAPAHAEDAVGSSVRASGDFERRASDAIYQVFPFDREAFYLTGSTSPGSGFALYGKSAKDFAVIDCRQTARFRVVRFANDVGVFSIGECAEERARLEDVVKDAPAGLRRSLDALTQVGSRPSEEELRRAGIIYEKRHLPDGSERHYFPVLVVGHGVIAAPTIVVIAKKSAWIVQAHVTTLCSQYETHRLCTDTMQSLSEIALHLATPNAESRPAVTR